MKITRRKALALAFMVGVVTGCTVPSSHAVSYGAGISHIQVTVEAVAQDGCTVSLSTGDVFELQECEDVENFTAGDLVKLEQDRDQGLTVLIAENGSVTLIN